MIRWLVLFAETVKRMVDDFGWSLGRAQARTERALAWVWNKFKTLPGVHHVGHAVATVLGLYRLVEQEDFEIALLLRIAAAGSGLVLILFLVGHV